MVYLLSSKGNLLPLRRFLLWWTNVVHQSKTGLLYIGSSVTKKINQIKLLNLNSLLNPLFHWANRWFSCRKYPDVPEVLEQCFFLTCMGFQNFVLLRWTRRQTSWERLIFNAHIFTYGTEFGKVLWLFNSDIASMYFNLILKGRNGDYTISFFLNKSTIYNPEEMVNCIQSIEMESHAYASTARLY
jgi:hypothetical protein